MINFEVFGNIAVSWFLRSGEYLPSSYNSVFDLGMHSARSEIS